LLLSTLDDLGADVAVLEISLGMSNEIDVGTGTVEMTSDT
jgi:hypothetical protein